MFEIGSSEILLIILLAVILLGPKKIPEIARSLGEFIAKARKVSEDFKDEINKSIDEKPPQEISDIAPKGSPKTVIKNEDDDIS